MRQIESGYELTDRQLALGVGECVRKADQLLNDAKALAKMSPSHALGLFTFAVEEYGKAVFLSKLRRKGQNRIVPHSLFHGKRSHQIKFEEAIKVLPTECTNLGLGVRIEASSGMTRTYKVAGEDWISVMAGTTGLFSTIGSTVNFDVRMETFYVDWDDSAKEWRPGITPDPKELKRAIRAFKAEIRKRVNSSRIGSVRFPPRHKISRDVWSI